MRYSGKILENAILTVLLNGRQVSQPRIKGLISALPNSLEKRVGECRIKTLGTRLPVIFQVNLLIYDRQAYVFLEKIVISCWACWDKALTSPVAGGVAFIYLGGLVGTCHGPHGSETPREASLL